MKLRIIIPTIVTFTILTIASCDHSKEGEVNISATNGKKSHNMGQNCMNCHKPGGSGEGIFRVAGTVYDSLLNNTNANGFIDLYTQPNGGGTFVKRLAVDAKGNFYTTEIIGLGNGLYPSVISRTGNKKYMSGSITSGACNSCHGVTQDKIWVNN